MQLTCKISAGMTCQVQTKPWVAQMETKKAIITYRASVDKRASGHLFVNKSQLQEQKASEHIKVKVKMPQGEGSETLRIANVGDGDVAKYHCRAKNSQGEREATADVTLMGTYACTVYYFLVNYRYTTIFHKLYNIIPYFRFAVPPRITELPHKTTLEFGTMIVVCESTGIPTPTITWQRVGDPFPYVDGFQPVRNVRRLYEAIIRKVTVLFLYKTSLQRCYGLCHCRMTGACQWSQPCSRVRVSLSYTTSPAPTAVSTPAQLPTQLALTPRTPLSLSNVCFITLIIFLQQLQCLL